MPINPDELSLKISQQQEDIQQSKTNYSLKLEQNNLKNNINSISLNNNLQNQLSSSSNSNNSNDLQKSQSQSQSIDEKISNNNNLSDSNYNSDDENNNAIDVSDFTKIAAESIRKGFDNENELSNMVDEANKDGNTIDGKSLNGRSI